MSGRDLRMLFSIIMHLVNAVIITISASVDNITRGSNETLFQALCFVYYMLSLDFIVFLLTTISLFRAYKYKRVIPLFYLLMLPVMGFVYTAMCTRDIDVDSTYTMFLVVKPYIVMLTYFVTFLLILIGIRKKTINAEESDGIDRS